VQRIEELKEWIKQEPLRITKKINVYDH